MTEESILIEPKRVCYACGSDKTYVWKGHRGEKHQWIINHDIDTGVIIGYLCRWCFRRLIEGPNRDKNTAHLGNIRRVLFRNKVVVLKSNPKIGVCNLCRAVAGQSNAQTGKIYKTTHIHHESYHTENPLKDTIEVCPRCHIIMRAERWKHIRRLEILLLKLSELSLD
jgi:hypothetical protein